MIQDLILGWFSSLLVGTLLGSATGLLLVLLAFFGLARLGCWRHPRLRRGWRITVLCLLGLLFAAIGGLSGATWGFCRAAEKKILTIDIVEAPFLREKMAPFTAAAGQFIGSALILAENPDWINNLGEAKQLPADALDAIQAFEKGERQLDTQEITKRLGSLSRSVIEKVFPMLEAKVDASQPDLLKSPLYSKMRPYLLDLMIGIQVSRQEDLIGDGQNWLIGSLAEASRRDGEPQLSRSELQAGIEKEGFHHLCCRPAAALIASQRWQFCLLLLALLLLPPLLFHILRVRLAPKMPHDRGMTEA